MNKMLRLLTLVAVALALFSSLGCDKLKARDQLNKGVKSYKTTTTNRRSITSRPPCSWIRIFWLAACTWRPPSYRNISRVRIRR